MNFCPFMFLTVQMMNLIAIVAFGIDKRNAQLDISL